jgi:poly(A) polymerase
MDPDVPMLKKLTRFLFGPPAKAVDATQSETGQAARSSNKPDKARKRKASSSGSPSRANNTSNLLKELDLRDADIIAREDHCITRKNISPNALKVLYRLNDAGFQAFLVGGGVRDLLLEGHPKDFDISTDATPEQVKELFRNSRVVGRRFKIAHVRFGREIIEVTTFRAHHNIETEVEDDQSRRHIRDLDSAHTAGGMILRDNVYGNINEDALRRDFTVNALYYTTKGFVLLDFVNGLADIKSRQIRMIGDPDTRFREDPVRILRAVRLAAKLDFDIEEATEAPLPRLAHLLQSISSARLFDETVKLFTTGKSAETFAMLRRYGIAEYLFKPVLDYLNDDNPIDTQFVALAFRNTDQRLAQGKSITPAFLYAALLWPALRHELLLQTGSRRPTAAQIQQTASDVIASQLRYTAIPKRFTAMMREMWELQWRLQPVSKRAVDSAMGHQRFRAAYDFLLLREEAGEDLGGTGAWWTRFQLGDRADQESMIEALQNTKKKRPRRRKPRKPSEPVG